MKVIINTPEGEYIVPVVDTKIMISMNDTGESLAMVCLLIPYPISGTEGPEWKLSIVSSESVRVVVGNDGLGGIKI